MNILIVEDELFAFERIKMLISGILPDINFIAHSQSVKQAVEIINNNKNINLGLFDIQLNDGLSFDIFEKTEVNFPVIFTTAFDNYAIKAFKLNSIDYLLKPVKKEELQTAIKKYNDFWNPNFNKSDISEIREIISKGYKTRFSIKVGEHIKIIKADNISIFYTYNKANYLKTFENRNYLIEQSLDNLKEILNPEIFFKINRKHIININAIKDIINYTNSRLKIILSTPIEDELIVAREKVNNFKLWLDK